MNELLALIRKRHAPCDKFICTTCGGLSSFVRDLEGAGLTGIALVHCLGRLLGKEVRTDEAKQRSFAAALASLDKTDQDAVMSEWLSRLGSDPDLAQGILLWTNFGENLTTEQMILIIDAALPILVSRKDLRQKLVSSQHLPDPLPQRLLEVITSDENETRRRQNNLAKLRQARQDYFRSLAEMPFERRVATIAADETIDPYQNWKEWYPWRSKWCHASDEEIDLLDAERTQQLIDVCETNPIVRCFEVLPRLYDRRHRLRQVVMEEVRRKYALSKPEDQLASIVIGGLVRIEHYPVELASVVTSRWLGALPEEARRHFVSEINRCKLKVWTRVRKRLSL